MSITRADVEQVARLAHLELGPEETDRLLAELGEILAYVQCLSTVDTTGIDPAESRSRDTGALREDAVQPGLDADTATEQAPQAEHHLFKVPPAFNER